VTLHRAALLIAEWFKIEEAFAPPDKIDQAMPQPVTRSKEESTSCAVAGKKSMMQPEVEDESVTENKPLAFELNRGC